MTSTLKKWLWPGAAVAAVWIATAPTAQATPRGPTRSGRAQLRHVAAAVEAQAGIPGFAAFAEAAANGETGRTFNNLAHNPRDSGAACRGFTRNAERYADNPYGSELFCAGSGGWYGFIPSTALFAPGFEHADPRLIYDPVASTVLLADYVRRIVRRYFPQLPAEHRNWLTIRRFMAGNTVGFDYAEQKVLKSDNDGVPRATKVRLRLGEDLRQTGHSESLMFAPVQINRWPGAATLLSQMRAQRGAA